jgi:hypothetical protein
MAPIAVYIVMRLCLFPMVLFLRTACLAQTPPSMPSNVHVELSLAGEQTTYKIGEPIRLRITFSATAKTALNVTTTDPASPVDELIVSPMHEVFPWLADQDDGQPYSPDYRSTVAIEPGQSQSVELPLNAVYRFDAAGHYSVRVVTRRIQGLGPQTTNTVGFDIQPMPDDEEASRAAELETKIRHARNLEIARGYARELDWLTGDPSTRVKLSLYLHQKTFYPFAVDVTKGLWIARNRTFVVEQLEKALKDPTQDLSPAGGLLETAVALRARMDAGPNRPAGSLRMQEVESGYLKLIAASLPQRTGGALVTAAQTVFIRLVRRKEVSGPEFAEAREILVTHFADVNEYNVDWMLNSYGTYLQDPRLVPALKQILASQIDPVLNGERTAALRLLVKLAPQDSHAEVVREVCRDNPMIVQIFGEIPFGALPETDACLQDSLALAVDSNKAVRIEWTAALIARFASAAPYDLLFALYRQSGAGWTKQAQGYMLAYLVRWNAERALPLLEAVLPATAAAPDSNISYAIGKVGYIPGIDSFWRKRLIGTPPEVATQAAFQMSQTGPKEDLAILRFRLDDWRAHWKGQKIPPHEATFEAELTQAVMNGANWHMSKDEIRALAAGCVSDDCRTRFAAQLGK